MPNQTFKPIEVIEKKEGPIVEIKKNIDGSSTKMTKEIFIRITIEKSIINNPKVIVPKNGNKVTMIKQKITKEYLTTILSGHNIPNEEKGKNDILSKDTKKNIFFKNNKINSNNQKEEINNSKMS